MIGVEDFKGGWDPDPRSAGGGEGGAIFSSFNHSNHGDVPAGEDGSRRGS